MSKFETRCQTCEESTRPGLLWLGGNDWLKCPDCDGTTVLKGYEEKIASKERTISIPGVGTIQVPVHHKTLERFL